MEDNQVVSLPPVPAGVQYIRDGDFYAALAAWSRICKRVVSNNSKVQLPPAPAQNQYTNAPQFYAALKAWEKIL